MTGAGPWLFVTGWVVTHPLNQSALAKAHKRVNGMGRRRNFSKHKDGMVRRSAL